MEIFKKALKMAITEQVEGVRFTANEPPALLQFANERLLSDLGSMTQEEVEGLISALIEEVPSSPGTPVKGELAIVNFGDLKLIGCPGDQAQLYGFIPPQGNQLFTEIWNRLSSTPQSTEPTKVSDLDQNDVFSISSIPEDEPRTTFPSSDGNTQMQGLPISESSLSYTGVDQSEDDQDSAMSNNVEVPESSSLSEPAEEDSYNNNNDLESLGFGQMTSDNSIHEAPSNFGSSESGQMSDFGSSESGEMSGFGTQETVEMPNFDMSQASGAIEESSPDLPGFDSFSHDAPDPGMGMMETTPMTAYEAQPQAATAPAPTYQPPPDGPNPTIHFGSTLPDEMIDPDQVNPIDDILRIMIEQDASDMHLTQNQPIAFRIDGEIKRYNDQPIDTAQMENLLLPIMPPKNQREFAACSDTDFAYAVPGLARFRVNIFRDLEGVGAVLRQIPDEVLTADQLGLPEAVRKLCYLSKGLVVVTGPTGSGKSTTLAAMIDLINATRKEHILTIEDPVEFVHKQKMCLVNQREVHKHTESFSRALRAALREDPDIILIGEMRDLETVAIAIETAETGHLVFGTLHTNTAISTIDRLVDQFPADQQEQIRVMLAESLKGVVAQTLVKKKGGGRCAAQEILIVDRAVSSLIREGNTHMMGNHMQTQKSKGNILLNEALMKLVTDGKIDVHDAWMKAVDKDSFAQLAESKGHSLKDPT